MRRILLFTVVLSIYSSVYAEAATIDMVTIHTNGGYSQTFDPNSSSLFENKFVIFGKADRYYLNDGTYWDSGAGSHSIARVGYVSANVNGSAIEYTFDPPEFYVIFENTDYNSGDHAAGGILKIDSNPVIKAENNTKMAKMEGYAEIIENYPENNIEDFNYYSAKTGNKVFYSINYWKYDGYWTADTFNESFEYNLQGCIDFTNVVPEPSSILVFLSGIIGLCRMARPR